MSINTVANAAPLYEKDGIIIKFSITLIATIAKIFVIVTSLCDAFNRLLEDPLINNNHTVHIRWIMVLM